MTLCQGHADRSVCEEVGGLLHQLLWLVTAHRSRLVQAFTNPPPGSTSSPELPAPSDEIEQLRASFCIAGEATGNGQALLFEAREKCSRLLAAADETSASNTSSEHADASPAAQLLLQSQSEAPSGAEAAPYVLEADWLPLVCVRPQLVDAQRHQRATLASHGAGSVALRAGALSAAAPSADAAIEQGRQVAQAQIAVSAAMGDSDTLPPFAALVAGHLMQVTRARQLRQQVRALRAY